MLLDPMLQSILVYDLNGNYLKTYSVSPGEIKALNKVYAVNDSIIMLVALLDDAFLLYSIPENQVVYSDFPTPMSLPPGFKPLNNVYRLGEKTYALVPMGLEIIDISKLYPELHYKWCFGTNNNSQNQIETLYELSLGWLSSGKFVMSSMITGKNKLLNHHILMVHETSSFNIVILEFEGDFKNVIIDKKTDNIFVFNSFKEGVIFPRDNSHPDRVISFYEPPRVTHPRDVDYDELENYFFNRNHSTYNHKLFSPEDQDILDNHDATTNNPFLVEFIFKD